MGEARTGGEPLGDVRHAGVLLHPTALGGPHGIGELGPPARRFVARIADAGLHAWQLLPLAPCGADGSPYAALSSFAGNPLLIAPTELRRRGWLPASVRTAAADPSRADFRGAAARKEPLLAAAHSEFRRSAGPRARREYERFVEHADQSCWLEDWALFAALRERQGGLPWFRWDPPLRSREPGAIASARRELAERVDLHRFAQFLFATQWRALRRTAEAHGVRIVGDLPFYPSHDSVDVWAHPHLFRLRPDGSADRVGGVPPDYFSDTGQRWGNPTFDWERLRAEGFAWWLDRLAAGLRQCDVLRLDHFRGFAAFWEIDAEEPTAVRGRWVPGPGLELFGAARDRLGPLPLIAEDLGVITDDVDDLRRALRLPGMCVLQFGLEDEERHDPARCGRRTVVYTGTHDNDTSRGWFESLAEDERQRVLDRVGAIPETVVPAMIEAVYRSDAMLAIVPLQDMLELGSEARMNRPGTVEGNWTWRAPRGILPRRRASWLRRLAERHGRA
jgi:4-alpha-glucanotransferase